MQEVDTYHIVSVTSRANAYEGHMFHDEVVLEQRSERVPLRAGDYVVPLDQDQARYAIEMLEPQGHDSFFRWGFFNSVLEKKEAYSDYVFEDHAADLLRDEPALAAKFAAWKAANPALLSDQDAVLDFIFAQLRAVSGAGVEPVSGLHAALNVGGLTPKVPVPFLDLQPKRGQAAYGASPRPYLFSAIHRSTFASSSDSGIVPSPSTTA